MTARDEIHTLREKAEIDEIAEAFQNGFTNGNAAWEETPEYHKDMFREGTRCALALLVSRTSNEALVKALEWSKGASPRTFVATTIVGAYKVMDANPVSDFIKPGWSVNGGGFAHVDTLDEAKAAAQTDYTSRIRSALSVGRGEEG